MPVFMVFIQCGFGGIKYFRKEDNAKKFADDIGEQVCKEYATAREFVDIKFEDEPEGEQW